MSTRTVRLLFAVALAVLVAGATVVRCQPDTKVARGRLVVAASPIPALDPMPAQRTALPTTTTTTAPAPPPTIPRPAPKAKPVPRATSSNGLSGWDCIRARESGGLVDPHGSNEGTGGYYQFEDSTWHAMGGTGHASSASYEEQTARAQALQQKSGWGQWSTASACHLR